MTAGRHDPRRRQIGRAAKIGFEPFPKARAGRKPKRRTEVGRHWGVFMPRDRAKLASSAATNRQTARPLPTDNKKFADLGWPKTVWAIGAVHGEVDRLAALHDFILPRFQLGDRLVYLGNTIGRGPAPLRSSSQPRRRAGLRRRSGGRGSDAASSGRDALQLLRGRRLRDAATGRF